MILAPGALDAAAPVPNPTVIGLIPQNAIPGDPSHDCTFFSSEIVEDFGYVEQEYILEGTWVGVSARRVGVHAPETGLRD